MIAPDKNIKTFSSLSEIRARKEELQKEIYADEEKMFYKRESEEPATPVQRMSNMINMGAGVIDGVILGWKIYRKFKGSRSIFKKKRR